MVHTAIRTEWPTATKARFLPRRDDAPVAGGQVGAFAAGGVDRDLAQYRFQTRTAVPGRGRDGTGPGLVVARTHAGPGGQIRGGAEPGGVGADLGQDDLSGAAADRRDRLDQVELPAKGLYLPAGRSAL